MAAKKRSAKPVNKSAFVRAIARDTPAKEVVAKAKAQGIPLTEEYVYSIRSKSKTAKKAKRAAGTSVASPRRATSAMGPLSELEGLIRRIVREEVQAMFRTLAAAR